METVSVIGAGAWGTAIAQAIAEGGTKVRLWGREGEIVETINKDRENKLFLPGVKLHQNIEAVSSLSETCKSDILMIVTPAQAVRDVLISIRSSDLKDKYVVLCSKGFELKTGLLLSEIAKEEVPQAYIAVMTGPTFAGEVAAGMPAAVTLAAAEKSVAETIQNVIGTKKFRPYITQDIIGAQIGGAAKNVIAIAAGISDGCEFGESARAALITRGLAEMSKLTSTMGGKKETLLGLCGVGDLFLTCSSMKSRNYSFGYKIAQGEDLQKILADRRAITEGYFSANALNTLANKQAVEMPIAQTVYEVLYEGLEIQAAIEQMLSRPFAKEV